MRLDDIDRLVRRVGSVGALVVFVVLYSSLVSGLRREKGRATENAPGIASAFARGSVAVYAPATVFGLGVLYLLWRPIKLSLSAPWRAAALLVGSLLYFPGLALMLWGRIALGEMHNVSTSRAVQLYAGHRLVTSGPFAYVRHPMYVGGVMAELGALLLYRTWATLALAMNIPNLVLRARKEEEALAAEFGDQWAEYRRRVPAWIPRLH